MAKQPSATLCARFGRQNRLTMSGKDLAINCWKCHEDRNCGRASADSSPNGYPSSAQLVTVLIRFCLLMADAGYVFLRMTLYAPEGACPCGVGGRELRLNI